MIFNSFSMDVSMKPVPVSDICFYVKSGRNYTKLVDFSSSYATQEIVKAGVNTSKIMEGDINITVFLEGTVPEQNIFKHSVVKIKDIYYGPNKELSLVQIILGDMYFGVVPSTDQTPSTYKAYELFKKNASEIYTPYTTQEKNVTAMPVKPKPAYKEVSPTDERISKIQLVSEAAYEVLKWVDNYELFDDNLSTAISTATSDQVQLMDTVRKSGDVLNKMITDIKSIVDANVKSKQGLFDKMFGNSVKLEENNCTEICNKIIDAGNVDLNSIEYNINNNIKSVLSKYDAIIVDIDNAVHASNFILSDSGADQAIVARKDRYVKMQTTTPIAVAQIRMIQSTFTSQIEQMREIREVLVPLLVVKIGNSGGKINFGDVQSIVEKLKS